MRRTLLLLLWILCTPGASIGQTGQILHADEQFHVAPGGALLGTVMAGTTLEPGERRDAWHEATLEGWIWAPSVRPDRRPGFDLVVSARNGENLRATPNGDRRARLQNGTLLVQIKREGQWVHVRRTGWIRAAAITEGSAPAATEEPAETVDGAATKEAPVSTESATTKAADALPSGRSGRASTATDDIGAPTPGRLRDSLPGPPAGGIAWTGQAGSRLHNSPAGDTLASIRPLTAVEVVERQGDWARVRLEGWVWAPALGTPADSGSVLTGLAPEVLLSNPEGFQGRLLEWEVQFISLNRAEKIRTDFAEGELFILARPPGDQPGFVYIAVPEAQRTRVEALTPLQRITILARVRAGRSSQMAAPILDLIELH